MGCCLDLTERLRCTLLTQKALDEAAYGIIELSLTDSSGLEIAGHTGPPLVPKRADDRYELALLSGLQSAVSIECPLKTPYTCIPGAADEYRRGLIGGDGFCTECLKGPTDNVTDAWCHLLCPKSSFSKRAKKSQIRLRSLGWPLIAAPT